MLPDEGAVFEPEALEEPSSGAIGSMPENSDATRDSCVPETVLEKVTVSIPALLFLA